MQLCTFKILRQSYDPIREERVLSADKRWELGEEVMIAAADEGRGESLIAPADMRDEIRILGHCETESDRGAALSVHDMSGL